MGQAKKIVGIMHEGRSEPVTSTICKRCITEGPGVDIIPGILSGEKNLNDMCF